MIITLITLINALALSIQDNFPTQSGQSPVSFLVPSRLCNLAKRAEKVDSNLTSDQHRVQLVLPFLQLGVDQADHAEVERVQLLRPVHGDDSQLVLHLEQHLL